MNMNQQYLEVRNNVFWFIGQFIVLCLCVAYINFIYFVDIFPDSIGNQRGDRTQSVAEGALTAAEWSEDLFVALIGLGYREMDVRRAIALVAKQEPVPINLQAYLKECLKFLSKNNARTVMGNA